MATGESFTTLVVSRFAFLDEMGFRSACPDDHEVRFEHDDGAFVQIFRAADDGYIGFRVGVRSAPRDAITAHELLQIEGASSQEGLFPSGEDMEPAVAQLAGWLRTYGQRALAGDPSVFEDARALRRRYTQRFTKPEG